MQTDVSQEVQTRVFTILDYLGEQAKNVGDLAKEQLPLLAQDIVRWGFWSNFVHAIVLFVLFILSIIIVTCSIKYLIKDDSFSKDPESKSVLYCVFSIIFSLSILICGINILRGTYWEDAIKAYAAPRVYLAEWCRDQVRSTH